MVLRNLFCIIPLLMAAAAHAQLYLPQTNVAACQVRSATQCAAVGCDGVQTKYWWPCQALTAPNAGGNSAAVIILPGTPYDVTTTNLKAPSPTGLSAAEQAALVPRAVMGTLLPDIIAEPTFKTRFTVAGVSPVKLSAINNSIDPAINPTWTNLGATATVDLESPTIQAMLSAMVADGLVTQAQMLVITTSVATVAQ